MQSGTRRKRYVESRAPRERIINLASFQLDQLLRRRQNREKGEEWGPLGVGGREQLGVKCRTGGLATKSRPAERGNRGAWEEHMGWVRGCE